MRHLRLVIVCLGLLVVEGISCQNVQDLKPISDALFDFYFPADSSLTSSQLAVRDQVKTSLWAYVNQSSDLKNSLLLPLVGKGFDSASNETRGQTLLALRRSDDPQTRQYAFTLRNTYISLCYHGNPLTNQIADVNPTPVIDSVNPPPPNQIAFSYPPSSLVYNAADKTIRTTRGTIDYLIVGSGPSGAIIAHELTQNMPNKTILIIDAGSFVIPGSFVTESYSDLMESNNRRFNTSGGIAIRNGHAVGGGTAVNVDLAFSPVTTPSIQTRINQWATNGLIDNSILPTDPNLRLQKLTSTDDWLTSQLKTRKVEVSEINANQHVLYDYASVGNATADTYSLNADKPTGLRGQVVKHSALTTFIMPALNNEGGIYQSHLDLIPDVKASRILFGPSSPLAATGVEVAFQNTLSDPCQVAKIQCVLSDPNHLNLPPQSSATIFAKHVIIAAGTLGSAELLLRTELSEPRFQNDQIGRGIVMHPSIPIPAMFSEDKNLLVGLPASVWAHGNSGDYFYEAMSADPAFAALVHPGSGEQIFHDIVQNFKKLGGFGVMLIDTPSDSNRVQLDTNGKAVVQYELSDGDKARMRIGIQNAIKIVFAAGAQKVILPTAEPILSSDLVYYPILPTSDYITAVQKIQFVENENFLSSAHMQGSNKAGPNASSSVVSPRFHVWDRIANREIDNLYVCDSSVFPTSVGANPMQSIYLFAKLFVDTLKN